jgi:hypothetical protein
VIWFIAYLLYRSRDAAPDGSAKQSGRVLQRGASGTVWQVSTGPDGTRVETLAGTHVLTFKEIGGQAFMFSRGDASSSELSTAILDFKVREGGPAA